MSNRYNNYEKKRRIVAGDRGNSCSGYDTAAFGLRIIKRKRRIL